METSTDLPIVPHDGKEWYFDARLREIREVSNPQNRIVLNDVGLAYLTERVSTPVRLVWKDEGLDTFGRQFGPAYTENAFGDLLHNYDWITWREASAEADRLGIELLEV